MGTTDQRPSRVARQEAESRYRRLVNGSPLLFYAFSTQRGGVFYSSRVESLLGYRVEQLLANPFLWARSIHPEDQPRVQGAIEAARRGRPFALEYRIRDARGYWLWLHDRSIAIQRDDDEAIIEGVALDITERKESEYHLRTMQAQLTHTSRIAALGEMAAGLIHETSQPLAHIAAWAEVASRQLRLDTRKSKQECERALKQIRDQINQLGVMLQRMRAFAGRADFRRVPFDLATAIDHVCSLMAPDLSDANVTLTVDVPAGLPRVLADGAQIQQVLVNLMRNGIEAMEAAQPAARRLGIAVAVQGESVRVSVCDAGTGVPPTKDLYDPFFTTKPGGMGLGLSITRTIIRAHGGTLGHTPNADRGTTFYFTLQVARAEDDDEVETDRLCGR